MAMCQSGAIGTGTSDCAQRYDWPREPLAAKRMTALSSKTGGQRRWHARLSPASLSRRARLERVSEGTDRSRALLECGDVVGRADGAEEVAGGYEGVGGNNASGDVSEELNGAGRHGGGGSRD